LVSLAKFLLLIARRPTNHPQFVEHNVIQKDKFKIVYVAPMKALAAEMTAAFGQR
jgi:replicative superfamily II helicase